MLECLDQHWSTSFKLRDPGDESPVPYRILMARIDGRLSGRPAMVRGKGGRGPPRYGFFAVTIQVAERCQTAPSRT
jgi:hypothetical protein